MTAIAANRNRAPSTHAAAAPRDTD